MGEHTSRDRLRFLRRPGFWALAVGTLPITMLILAVVPPRGFFLYLWFSSAYHSLPQLVFGRELFPTHEFGTIADGAGAQILAMCFYAVLGYVLVAAIRFAVSRFQRSE